MNDDIKDQNDYRENSNFWLPDFDNPEQVESCKENRINLFIWMVDNISLLTGSLLPSGFDRDMWFNRRTKESSIYTGGPSSIEKSNQQFTEFAKHYNEFINIITSKLVSNISNNSIENLELDFPEDFPHNEFFRQYFTESSNFYSYLSGLSIDISAISLQDFSNIIFENSQVFIQTIGRNLQGDSENCTAPMKYIKDSLRIVFIYWVCFGDLFDYAKKKRDGRSK